MCSFALGYLSSEPGFTLRFANLRHQTPEYLRFVRSPFCTFPASEYRASVFKFPGSCSLTLFFIGVQQAAHFEGRHFHRSDRRGRYLDFWSEPYDPYRSKWHNLRFDRLLARYWLLPARIIGAHGFLVGSLLLWVGLVFLVCSIAWSELDRAFLWVRGRRACRLVDEA